MFRIGKQVKQIKSKYYLKYFSNKNINNQLINTLNYNGKKIINNLYSYNEMQQELNNEHEQEEIDRLDIMSKLHLEGED